MTEIATGMPLPDDDRLAKRNVLALSIAQALYGMNAAAVMTMGSIIGYNLADDKAYATLPITSFVAGTAIATIPASLLMQKIGRRNGFRLGAAFAMLSGSLAIYAITQQSFLLFCLAIMFSGFYQAFAQYYRFAATDTASEAFRPKAVSLVLAGGIVAAILGPQLVIWTKDLAQPLLFVGTFFALILLGLAAMIIVSFVNIPLPPKGKTAKTDSGRPLLEILKQKRLILAILTGMVGYAGMNLVMTATPLAMLGCNHTTDDAAHAIQWHVVAMYAPSFFTGSLILRFGVERVMFTGIALLAACGIVANMGLSIPHFWVAMIFLGVGWNFAFIGATSLVTECHRPEERGKVQALNDFCVFAFVGGASLLSGKILHSFGWEMVNMTLFPFLALIGGLLLWTIVVGRAEKTQ